jgi:hypothetical protein
VASRSEDPAGTQDAQANPGGARHTRGDWVRLGFELLVWGGGAVVWIWKLPSIGALAVIGTLYWLYRLVGSVLLFRAQRIDYTQPSPLQRAAGWCFVSRTFATGLAFSAAMIAIMVHRPEKAVIVFSLIFLVPSLIFIVVGLRLMKGWRQRLQDG